MWIHTNKDLIISNDGRKLCVYKISIKDSKHFVDNLPRTYFHCKAFNLRRYKADFAHLALLLHFFYVAFNRIFLWFERSARISPVLLCVGMYVWVLHSSFCSFRPVAISLDRGMKYFRNFFSTVRRFHAFYLVVVSCEEKGPCRP